MATIQDPFENENLINSLEGSEVNTTDDILQNTHLNSGRSLYFDDANLEQVQIPFHADYDLSGGWAVGGWFKMVDDPTVVHQLLWFNGDFPASDDGWGVDIQNSTTTPKVRFLIHSGGSGDQTVPDLLLNVGEWYHFVFTRDTTGNVLGYVNGNEYAYDSQDNADPTGMGSGQELFIGGNDGQSGWGNRYSNANIADVRIYNGMGRALTKNEVIKWRDGNAVDSTYLVGHWKLDETSGTNAADSSTNANDGTHENTPTHEADAPYALRSRTTSTDKLGSVDTWTAVNSIAYTTAKKPGGSEGRIAFSADYDSDRENVLSFDGVDDHIDLDTHASNLSPDDNHWSIAVWFRTTATSRGVIYGASNTSGSDRLQLEINDSSTNVLEFNADDDANIVSLVGTTVVNDGNWHLGYVTRDTDTPLWSLYVDGELQDTGVNSATSVDATDGAMIGAYSNNGSDLLHFSGDIGAVAIWNDVRAASEVLDDFKGEFDTSDANMEAYWPLNEGTGTNATDNKNSNDGTLTNGPTWTTDTWLPDWQATWKNANNDTVTTWGALSFDGVNDEISVPDDSTLQFTNQLTLMAWCYLTSYTGGPTVFAKYSISGSRQGYYMNVNGTTGILQFAYDTDSTTTFLQVASTHAVPLNRWVHLAATYNSDTNNISLYIDGVKDGEQTSSISPLGTGTSDFYIGRYSDSAAQYWKGSLSDLRAYSEALSEATILSYVADSIEPSTTNLEGHWKLDGNALDSTANDNDGTVSGATFQQGFENAPQVGDALNQREVASFDGVNDSISVADDGSQSGMSGLTLSGWVWIPTDYSFNSSGTDNFLSKDASGQRAYYIGSFTGGVGRFLVSDDGSTKDAINTVTELPLSEWFHIAGTYDGSTIKIYLNGVEDNTASTVNATGTINASTQQLLFGYNGFGTGNYFEGKLANFNIYSDVRTASEILTDYQNGYVDTSDANLVSYWALDGDYLDWVGSSHGTNSGSTMVKAIEGPMGTRNFGYDEVLDLNGSSDYINVGNDSSFDVTSFSVSMWVKPNTLTAFNTYFSKEGSSAGTTSFQIDTPSGQPNQIRLFVYDSAGGARTINSSTIMVTDQWQHIVAIYNSGVEEVIYHNGTEVGQGASGGTGIRTTTTDVIIGATDVPGRYFDGKVQDVRFYNDALTADEVNYILTNGELGTDPTTTNLVSQWLINEGTGTTITDSQGSNDGTLTGGTWSKSNVPPMNNDGQVTIDLEDASLTDTVYVKTQMSGPTGATAALTEITIDYSATVSELEVNLALQTLTLAQLSLTSEIDQAVDQLTLALAQQTTEEEVDVNLNQQSITFTQPAITAEIDQLLNQLSLTFAQQTITVQIVSETAIDLSLQSLTLTQFDITFETFTIIVEACYNSNIEKSLALNSNFEKSLAASSNFEKTISMNSYITKPQECT